MLVAGLEHFLFSRIYGIILPIDFHIFQDGCCTTNQMNMGCSIPKTQWFCWSLSLWKMAISLGIYPIFRQTHIQKKQWNMRNMDRIGNWSLKAFRRFGQVIMPGELEASSQVALEPWRFHGIQSGAVEDLIGYIYIYYYYKCIFIYIYSDQPKNRSYQAIFEMVGCFFTDFSHSHCFLDTTGGPVLVQLKAAKNGPCW